MATHSNNDPKYGLDEVLTRFINAYVRDESPDIDEFVKQYPQHENQIRRRVESLSEIDALFNSLIKADQSDFNGTVTEDNLVGQKIGSFEIVEIIGRGGMGVVYRAHDSKLDRTVAIKTIPPELAGSSTTRTRFRREARLLASLNHPNIAVIHDIIEEEKSGYLILEYVPGQTLAQRLTGEPIKLEDALSIGRQVAEAVSAAHKKGVVHRDLKPGNIKITPDDRIKVLDFGLAKASGAEEKKIESNETQRGRIIGTPAYMSPEQARGKETDHRTDIWSFGCIIYQILVGRLPFEGETATDTLAHIIEHQPDWDALPKQIPANIRTLLERCLEKEPDRRLGDITEAVNQINETLSTLAQPLSVRLKRMVLTVLVTVTIVLSAIAVWFTMTNEAPVNSKQNRLVVVPFKNLGPAEDEYFADGITDDIRTRLEAISELSIISRWSAIQYKNKEVSTRQIAQELNVDYILEGTVQSRAQSDPNNPIRIRPQLIKVSDDKHVWASVYNSNISGIFNLQSEVARQVAQALGITLLEREKAALASIPTNSMEAWNYYLQGNYNLSLSGDPRNSRDARVKFLRTAIGIWENAIALDPNFTFAHTQLSHVFTTLYFNFTRSPEDLEKAKEHVQAAEKLDPNLPEVHQAWGHYYYQGKLDYDSALREYAIVLESRPHDDKALSWTGWAYKRQGKLEQALVNLRSAYEYSPRFEPYPFYIGWIYELMDRYDKAESYYNQAIALDPDKSRGYYSKMLLYLRQGDTKKARQVQKEFSQYPNVVEDPEVMNTLVHIDVYERNYQAALDRLSSILVKWPDDYPGILRQAQIYQYWQKEDIAGKYYAEVRAILERKIQEDPNNAKYQCELGIAYAGLGLKDKAILAGQKARKEVPVSKDALRGSWVIRHLALIYTMVGEYDRAIDQIEDLLSRPGPLSIPLLQLDPAWDPLRNHPRFKKLLESSK
ncbi:MAG: protein kinase [Sedimentisphaerales bacterium]|nr:protein kinase [Sedimentisphaerales bacterium]